MILKVENFAKIKNAEVKIDGITVIAGENNTGKSTIGKLLYSIFYSFKEVEKKIEKQKRRSIYNVLNNNLSNHFLETNAVKINHRNRIKFLTDLIFDELNKHDLTYNDIKIIISSYLSEKDSFTNLYDLDNITKKIYDISKYDNNYIVKIILKNALDDEFKSQLNYINNLSCDANINLLIKNINIGIKINNNIVTDIDNIINLYTDPIYLENPFILGYNRFDISGLHSELLYDKIMNNNLNNNEDFIEKDILLNKLEKILVKINSVVKGSFDEKGDENYIFDSLMFKFNDLKISLNVSNLSTGLKTFVIIKRLIENGYFQENGLIILDEPEIHLHPEWQLIFAEMLVLIQKEFNMNIVITTHSPYFLNAIEVYSKLYNITDKCNYYLAELDKKDSTVSYIRDVTKSTSEIYDILAEPLHKLENLFYLSEDNNGI